jgi:hypothetical protein
VGCRLISVKLHYGDSTMHYLLYLGIEGCVI